MSRKIELDHIRQQPTFTDEIDFEFREQGQLRQLFIEGGLVLTSSRDTGLTTTGWSRDAIIARYLLQHNREIDIRDEAFRDYLETQIGGDDAINPNWTRFSLTRLGRLFLQAGLTVAFPAPWKPPVYRLVKTPSLEPAQSTI